MKHDKSQVSEGWSFSRPHIYWPSICCVRSLNDPYKHIRENLSKFRPAGGFLHLVRHSFPIRYIPWLFLIVYSIWEILIFIIYDNLLAISAVVKAHLVSLKYNMHCLSPQFVVAVVNTEFAMLRAGEGADRSESVILFSTHSLYFRYGKLFVWLSYHRVNKTSLKLLSV